MKQRIAVVSVSLLAVAGVVTGIALAWGLFVPQVPVEAQTGTPNNPPVISSDPVTQAVVGQQYVYQVEASDPDQDPLVFSLPIGPVGMAIDDSTGLILWTPDASQVGDHPVEVIVEDGEFLEGGLNDSQEFIVTVSDPNRNGDIPGGGGTVNINTDRLDQAIEILDSQPSPDAAEEAINHAMDVLMGTRPLPTKGIEGTRQAHEAFNANEQKVIQALERYALGGGGNRQHKGLALNALQIVQEMNEIAATLAPITAQCGTGDFILQDGVNNFLNPCSQLQPLINNSTGLENEPVFSPDDIVFGQGPTLQPIDPLTRSYSTNLRADLVPPKWSRDIPEHVEITEPLAPGECSVVFKEFRGLLMQLHIEAITAIKDPGNKSGVAGSTSEPLWVLRWMPAQYGKQWIMCNTGTSSAPTVTTTVTRQIVEDEGLVYFWRFYE